MLKYYLIVVLNLPLVLFGILSALQGYSRRRISRLGLGVWLAFWSTLGVGLFLVRPIYIWLEEHNLTDSVPLSIFDVVEVTGIIFALSLIFRLYSKMDTIEQRIARFNSEASITFSEHKNIAVGTKVAAGKPKIETK